MNRKTSIKRMWIISLISILVIFSHVEADLSANQDQHKSWGAIVRLAWSPLGDRIAFESIDQPNMSSIWLVNVNGLNPIKLTKDHESASFPEWSPNGDFIAFWVNAEDVSIITVDGSREINLTSDLEPVDAFFKWSPDGQYIVATSYSPKDDLPLSASIWSIRINDSKTNLLVEEKAVFLEYQPNWSSDGQQILFTYVSGLDDLSKITYVDVNDFNQTILISGRYFFSTLSPDNLSIATFSNEGCSQGFDIILIDISNLQYENITKKDCSAIGFPLEWSPDNNYIVYQTSIDTFNIIDINNHDIKEFDGMNPVWSPDSSQIAFISFEADGPNIWLLDIDEFSTSMVSISED